MLFNCCLSQQEPLIERTIRTMNGSTISQSQLNKIIQEDRNEIRSTQIYTTFCYSNSKSKPIDVNKRIEDFNLLKLIGKGKSGKVILVQEKQTDELTLAMKIVDKQYLKYRNIKMGVSNKQIHKYLDILDNNHPFLCQVQFVFYNHKKTYILFDFIQGGQLFKHLTNTTRFQEDWGKLYVCQMILGLEKIHESGYIYCNLNPNHILLDKEGNIKIVDFGDSNVDFNGEYYKQNPQELIYVAPEIHRNQEYNRTADFWSLGMIVYEMLNGASPFYNRDKSQMLNRILNEQILMKSIFSEAAISFVELLLVQDNRNRLGSEKGIEELKSHRWFYMIDWDSIYNKQYESPIQPKVVNGYDTRNFEYKFTKQSAYDTPYTNNIMSVNPRSNTDNLSKDNNHRSYSEISHKIQEFDNYLEESVKSQCNN